MRCPTPLSLNLLPALTVAGFALAIAAAPADAASGSVKCSDGKTYTASVPGGSCSVGANWVKCTGSNGGDTASVSCINNPGPCTSGGGGSCKSEMTVKGDSGTTVRGGLKVPHGMMSKQPMMKKSD